jgi:hypothetical protein
VGEEGKSIAGGSGRREGLRVRKLGGRRGVMERCERVRSGGLLRKKQNCK